jgi:preprotein translocase subunit SecE
MADKVNKKSEKSAARKKASLKFFKDIRSELKKVTWLSWPKLVKNTITVRSKKKKASLLLFQVTCRYPES